MKFSCDRCQSRYSIADEKIRGKVLRIRCKKCGHIMEVRDPTASAAAASASQAGPSLASEAPRPASRAAASALAVAPLATSPRTIDDELEQAFGRVVAEGSKDRRAGRVAEPLEDAEKTALFDYSRDFFEGHPEGAAPKEKEPSEAVAPAASPEVVEWYLAIDGQQIGPLPIAEAQARLLAEAAADRAYAWRDGMADWARIADVPELRSLLPEPPPEPSRPSPAPVIEAVAVPSEGRGSILVASAGALEPAPPEAQAARSLEAHAASVPEPQAAASPEAKPAASPEAGRMEVKRPEALLELEIEESPPIPASRTEPISLQEPDAARSEAHDDLEFPTAIPAEAPSILPVQRHRVSVATLVLLVLLLLLGIVILLGAFDLVPLPFMGSDSAGTVNRKGVALEPSAAQQRLGRDPLLDRETPQIVVQQVPMSSKTLARNRRNGRPREVVDPEVPAPPTAPAPATSPPPPALSALDKKVYGGGTGLPEGPRLPEHLVARTTVPPESARGLSQEVISEVIRKFRSGIQNCYDRQLRRDPSVKGRLTLSLRIGKSGRVQSATVESKMRDTIVARCVVQLAQTWRFPPSGSEVEVDYPLIFEKTQ
jgi:predicted Zn finger-like uncharacterized protein